MIRILAFINLFFALFVAGLNLAILLGVVVHTGGYEAAWWKVIAAFLVVLLWVDEATKP